MTAAAPLPIHLQLGVNMVVDDRGTNDVHADEMGGWPPVVKPVLSVTKGADYEVG